MKATGRSFQRASRKIRKYAREVGGSMGPALVRIGEEIRTDVVASRPGAGVPRDEGVLAASVVVEGPFGSSTRPHAVLAAGGAAQDYALIQHERTDFRHELGEARYLVRGVERWEPGQAIRALRANAEAAARRIGREAD